ncbi:MAG: hypothetical protein WA184_02525 [Stellaceae bacterium]
MGILEDAAARAAGWLKAWDSQGIHRTGTAGDQAGAEWLASEAARLGFVPAVEELALERLDPVAAYLEVDGVRISGVPVFDAPATAADGIAGRLGPIGPAAAIGVVELSPHAVYAPDYEKLRRASGHDALVVVCKGARPGTGLLNAEQFRHPYGAPAIHVSSEARETVFAAAARGADARLVADSRRTLVRGCNIVVTIPGREPRRAPVVVMTPRSSWWQSTAERGGGLVCWLETLRALAAARPASDVVFTANSGHELGHLGLDDFLARRPGWERPAAEGGAMWVHYGANIGAAGGALSILSNDQYLAALAADELTRAGHPPARIAPPDFLPSGETRDIHRAGGRYLTLVGTNPLFHLPDDRWPHAVDPAVIARIAIAAAAMVAALTKP